MTLIPTFDESLDQCICEIPQETKDSQMWYQVKRLGQV